MVSQRSKQLNDSVPVSASSLPGQPRRSERRERRSPLSVMLKICGFSAAGRIFSELTSTQNISRSGCRVRLRTQPLENATLALQVVPREGPLPEAVAPILYQVAWLEPHPQGWDVGLMALADIDLLKVAFSPLTP